jgi:hypothetical protein
MGNVNYNSAGYSKSRSGLLLPKSVNIKDEQESRGINQTEISTGQKGGESLTQNHLNDKLRLIEKGFELRVSEANGQLVSRLVGVEQRLEAVSKDLQRLETGNTTIAKEMRDAKRWQVGLIVTVVIACISISAKLGKTETNTATNNNHQSVPETHQMASETNPQGVVPAQPTNQERNKENGDRTWAIPPTTNLPIKPKIADTNH